MNLNGVTGACSCCRPLGQRRRRRLLHRLRTGLRVDRHVRQKLCPRLSDPDTVFATTVSGLLPPSATPPGRPGEQPTTSRARISRACTALSVLTLSLLVDDVVSAVSAAYNLLVGGLFVPVLGGLRWERATPADAMAAMPWSQDVQALVRRGQCPCRG